MNRSEQFWDKMSKNFDKHAKKFEKDYVITLEYVRRYLNPEDVVLDYACGTGIITTEIADKVKKVQALDLSAKMIEAAKRKADELKIENVDFVKSTLFDERYKKESFDVILVVNALHLLNDTPHIVQRIKELLKPGGTIVSVTPCIGEKFFLKMLLLPLSKIGILPYIRFFKIPDLLDSICGVHFKLVEAESLNHSPLNYFIAAKKMEMPAHQAGV